MRLSEYLTLAEGIKSQTAIRLGIKNEPTEEHLANMKFVAANVFDPVRRFVNGPLHASSFYRSKALNDAIGGSSSTSQHMKGEAIDIDCDTFGYGSNAGVFTFIKKYLEFDQLIFEYPDIHGNPAWVHVSLRRDGKNRKQVLVKLRDRYIPFSEWKVGMI
jgi:zinc D-Ala-D-Ala carboxypeptidase